MTALREIFARFGIEVDTAGLNRGNAGVEGLTERLQGLGRMLAGGAVVVAMRSFVQDIAHVGDELDKSSQALGLSTDRLQEWRAAAGHAGVSAEQLTPALQAVRRNASAAAATGGQMGADFRALGVSLRDEHGNLRETDDLMRQIAEGMQGMDDPTQRAAIAMRLMGESGARLIPLLANGAEGVDAAAQAFRALGGGMSRESIQAAADYTDAVQDVDDALTGIKSRIAIFILPVLTRLAEGMSQATAAFSRAEDRGALLTATLATLGSVAAAAAARTVAGWIAAAAPFVALAVVLGAAILIVEDLIVGIHGGQSALAEWGTGFQEWAESATGPMETVAGFLLAMRDLIRLVVDGWVEMGVAISRVFGLEPPSWVLALAASVGPETEISRSGGGAAPAQQAGAMEQVRAARAANERARALAAESLRATLPGATAGVIANDLLRGRPGGGEVRQDVSIGRIEVNAPGGDPEMVRREATRAVTAALRSQADDTLDTIGGGR